MSHLGELLSAYLDGETTPDESRQVVDHLNGCDRCQTDMEDVHAARSALRAMPTLELPSSVLDAVGGHRIAEVVPLRRRPIRMAAAAAAAVVVLFIGLATFFAPQPTSLTVDDITNEFGAVTQFDALPAVTKGVVTAPAEEAE